MTFINWHRPMRTLESLMEVNDPVSGNVRTLCPKSRGCPEKETYE